MGEGETLEDIAHLRSETKKSAALTPNVTEGRDQANLGVGEAHLEGRGRR